MAISQQPSSCLPPEMDPLIQLGRQIKALKSPQATRISESRGRTELHTSNLIYMSHPSSSTSFGGVYPKAAHTGLLPCKGECPKESKGLCCAQQSEGPQAPARTRNIPQWLLAGCSCYQGRLSLFWAKDTAQVGEDTWLWDLCYQKVIRGTLGRVNFQMSEG